MSQDEPFDLEAYKKAIEEEFAKNPEKYETAQQILEESAPAAALQLVVIMQHCPDPRVRLSASKYLLDNTVFAKDGDEDSLRNFLSNLNAKDATS